MLFGQLLHQEMTEKRKIGSGHWTLIFNQLQIRDVYCYLQNLPTWLWLTSSKSKETSSIQHCLISDSQSGCMRLIACFKATLYFSEPGVVATRWVVNSIKDGVQVAPKVAAYCWSWGWYKIEHGRKRDKSVIDWANVVPNPISWLTDLELSYLSEAQRETSQRFPILNCLFFESDCVCFFLVIDWQDLISEMKLIFLFCQSFSFSFVWSRTFWWSWS